MTVETLIQILESGPVGVLAIIAFILWRMERALHTFTAYLKGRNEVQDEIESTRDAKLNLIHNAIVRRNHEEDRNAAAGRVSNGGL